MVCFWRSPVFTEGGAAGEAAGALCLGADFFVLVAGASSCFSFMSPNKSSRTTAEELSFAPSESGARSASSSAKKSSAESTWASPLPLPEGDSSASRSAKKSSDMLSLTAEAFLEGGAVLRNGFSEVASFCGDSSASNLANKSSESSNLEVLSPSKAEPNSASRAAKKSSSLLLPLGGTGVSFCFGWLFGFVGASSSEISDMSEAKKSSSSEDPTLCDEDLDVGAPLLPKSLDKSLMREAKKSLSSPPPLLLSAPLRPPPAGVTKALQSSSPRRAASAKSFCRRLSRRGCRSLLLF
mmetsp:Transcript_3238/g.6185  ORF Transcript_3238/g.6185 Transcript_3238/m.6185 type:complete len:296 (-) Transcript_3238:196-1083(-)